MHLNDGGSRVDIVGDDDVIYLLGIYSVPKSCCTLQYIILIN